MQLVIKYLHHEEQLKNTTFAPHGQSAGYDLCVAVDEPVVLQPNESKLLPTGISLRMYQFDCGGFIFPRSGLGSKGIVLRNTVGVIDPDYTGEIKLAVWNTTNEPVTIEPFQRVAQIVFLPVTHPSVFYANSTTDYLLPDQEIKGVVTRGDKGFGSTGI